MCGLEISDICASRYNVSEFKKKIHFNKFSEKKVNFY